MEAPGALFQCGSRKRSEILHFSWSGPRLLAHGSHFKHYGAREHAGGVISGDQPWESLGEASRVLVVRLDREESKDTPDPPCKAVRALMDSMGNGNCPLYQDHDQLARYPGGSRRVGAVKSSATGLLPISSWETMQV